MRRTATARSSPAPWPAARTSRRRGTAGEGGRHDEPGHVRRARPRLGAGRSPPRCRRRRSTCVPAGGGERPDPVHDSARRQLLADIRVHGDRGDPGLHSHRSGRWRGGRSAAATPGRRNAAGSAAGDGDPTATKGSVPSAPGSPAPASRPPSGSRAGRQRPGVDPTESRRRNGIPSTSSTATSRPRTAPAGASRCGPAGTRRRARWQPGRCRRTAACSPGAPVPRAARAAGQRRGHGDDTAAVARRRHRPQEHQREQHPAATRPRRQPETATVRPAVAIVATIAASVSSPGPAPPGSARRRTGRSRSPARARGSSPC